jgi:hypothetical protein
MPPRLCAAVILSFVFLPLVCQPACAAGKHHAPASKKKKQAHHKPVGIWVAIRNGDISSIRWHLRHGMSVNYADSAGGTLLLNAILGGKYEVVKYLISVGADANATCLGRSATEWCKPNSQMQELVSAAAKKQQEAAAAAAESSGFHSYDRDLRLNLDTMDTTASGGHNVNGFVHNRTDSAYSYVEVDVAFYTDGGVRVDDGVAITRNLGAWESWEFNITTPSEDVTSYKVTAIKGIR